MTYLAKENRGRKVSLLRSAGTRMALFFYAMFRALRLSNVLISVVNGPKFRALKLNKRMKAVVNDLKDIDFFINCMYSVSCVVYSNVCLFCYCNKSTPIMEHLYHHTLQTNVLLELSHKLLNDNSLFPKGLDSDLTQEEEQVFGDST